MEDRLCHSKDPIDAPTDVSLFFAHPFTEKKIEHISHLAEAIRARFNVPTRLPFEQASDGVIFCKLCSMIRSSSAILSDFTELNRNVLFEHGFAIGLGRRGIQVRERGFQKQSELDVLSDIEFISYNNREEILAEFSKRFPGHLEIRYAQSGEPKILGEWDLSAYVRIPDRVAFLKLGQQKTDSLKRIEKVLRKSNLSLDIIDTQEHITHQLHSYCVRLREASFVVGHFVSDKRTEHLQANALTALLVGIALGFGRRVLLLQETPVLKPMIDVKGVIHTYETEAAAERVLSETVDRWKQAVKQEKGIVGARINFSATQQAALSLGNAVAESDDLLDKAFIPTDFYRWALKAEKFLIVGPRGSGKTAVYKRVTSELADNASQRVILLEPTDMQMARVQDMSRLEYKEMSAELVLRSVWRLTVLSEIAHRIVEGAGPGAMGDSRYMELQDTLNAHELPHATDFGTRFLAFLDGLGPLTDQENRKLRFLQARLPQLKEALTPILKDVTIRLFVDNLDKSWAEMDATEVKCVAALVHECFTLRNEFQGKVLPTIFIRKDILEVLRDSGTETDKWEVGQIKWTRERLRQLLELRLKVAMEMRGQAAPQVVWEAVLEERINGQSSIEYILDRALPRPRDCMQVLQSIISVAQDGGALPASATDILTALRSSASERVINIGYELRGTLPEFSTVIKSIVKSITPDPMLSEYELQALLRRMLHPDWTSSPEAVNHLFDNLVVCYVDVNGYLMSREFDTSDTARAHADKVVAVERVPRFSLFPWLFMREIGTASPAMALHPAFAPLGNMSTEPVNIR